MILAIFTGILFGFAGAIPIAGPVSALVLKAGLRHQYRRGRALGFGAGLAEALYVMAAFAGFKILLEAAPDVEKWTSTLAGIVLIGVGIHFLFTKPPAPVPSEGLKNEQGKSAFLFGFGVSIVNPALIASWTTVVTSLNGFHLFEYSILNSTVFASGVWLGTGIWFALMLKIIRANHHRFKPSWIRMTFLGVGIFLITLGLAILKTFVFKG